MTQLPPPDDEPPRPLISPAFWIMLGFCFLCVVGGVMVVLLGPWLTGHGAPPPPAPVPAAAPAKP
ncbi:hypothetical protein ACO2Q3_22385 [Caulobacter sp. KR2-114]|uniref:hypothetical protein n=1 Tax=Caulobacter sp. KR2-114 TaxID=3400912 RepID=UPI003C08187C